MPRVLFFINLDALRLIRNIKKNPAKAASLKMAHFSNIGVTEVFLEATPTTFITTVLFASYAYSGRTEGYKMVLIGRGWSAVVQFLVGYAASIMSSAFGVSR